MNGMIRTGISVPPALARAEQRCGNCNAFSPNKQANPRAGEPRQGWCRATTPTLMQGMSTNALGQNVPVIQGGWPPTNDDQWCRGWMPED